MGRRTNIDWHALEVDYRLGVESIRSIARKHKVADSALRRHSKAHGWQRDCRQTIDDATAAATERALDETVRGKAQEIGALIGAEKAREIERGVQEAVLTATEVIQHHQRESRRAMRVIHSMVNELEAMAQVMPAIEKELSALGPGDPGRIAAIERAVGLKGRAETLDRTMSAMSKAAAMERQAHGLDREAENKGREIDELLKKVHAEMVAKGLA